MCFCENFLNFFMKFCVLVECGVIRGTGFTFSSSCAESTRESMTKGIENLLRRRFWFDNSSNCCTWVGKSGDEVCLSWIFKKRCLLQMSECSFVYILFCRTHLAWRMRSVYCVRYLYRVYFVFLITITIFSSVVRGWVKRASVRFAASKLWIGSVRRHRVASYSSAYPP